MHGLGGYRDNYVAYYRKHARPDSPALRDAVPSVVLVPGIGMFSFGKNKSEARITGEFYTNAIHVMEGATALDDKKYTPKLPQAGAAASERSVHVFSTTTWRFRVRKRFALNTGNWKKQNSAVNLRRSRSAGRYLWSWEERTELGARWRPQQAEMVRTWWWRIAISRQRKKQRKNW